MTKTKAKTKTKKDVEVVTALELMALETERQTLVLLRRQVREAELRVHGREAELIAKLESGAVVTGDVTAVVETREGDCRPAWKDLMLEHMLRVHSVDPQTYEAQARALTPRQEKKVLVINKKGADGL